MLFFCTNLHAQVTIGGLEEPKAGAVLDLNSTSKGGLLLSNVSIEDFFKIPSTFHGGGGEDTALKEGLTGAMIYNTNPAFCIGVHVWNGQHWGRIATTTPVPAPGALSIPSGAANLLGGDEVEFTASSDAKTYRWFAGKNGAAYEYLGITTASTYTETFPAGAGRMKVIMDDCRSVKESELSFSMGSVSPNFGSLAGGNYIYIYGDFPYAATDDYAAQESLVTHYDGINNRGQGDKRHDYSSTASWKDLKNPTFDFPRTSGAGQWLSNGFQALDNNSSFSSAAIPGTYPIGNSARTVEVIFRTPEESKMFEQVYNTQRLIFIYGTGGESKMFGVLYRGALRDACSSSETPEKNWIFYAISGFSRNLMTCISSTPSLKTPNTINTVTSTYGNSMQDENYTNSYINNIPATIVEREGGTLDTQPNYLQIGENLSHSTFLSVRLYNRVLTSDEIELNAGLDQKRYLTPPAVTIGGNPCTEVVVLSDHFLMCKVPPGSSEGPQDVEVNGVTYSGAYRYVHSTNDFYVSSISPIIGSAGMTLTLEGNRLGEIGEVLVDGKICTPSGSATSTEYECIIPENLSGAGEVDITIKLNDDTVYRFARVFEYQ